MHRELRREAQESFLQDPDVFVLVATDAAGEGVNLQRAHLMDNPGIRELQSPACQEGLLDVFDDVVRIAANCRFSNCSHDGDADCAVLAAVASGTLDQRRLTSFRKLIAEQARNSRTLAKRLATSIRKWDDSSNPSSRANADFAKCSEANERLAQSLR